MRRSISNSRDRRGMEAAARRLDAIPVGAPPEVFFDALRACAPIAGGLIGAMRPEVSGSVVSHVVGLPDDVLEAWADTPLPHMHRMMAPLLPAAPGELISDRMAIRGPFREELSLLRVLRSAGLGESAGYKVAAGGIPRGQPEHRFLTLALEDRESFTSSQRAMFRLLHPRIEATLARMAVPLLPREPMLAQIVEERRLGYMCLSSSHGVVELNERIHELARQYRQAAGVEPGRGWLARFAERVLLQTSGGREWHLVRDDSQASVEITAHRLDPQAHGLAQALTLVMARESQTCLPSAADLTPRRREAAYLLVHTHLSYKEIAARMGISEGTVRKHVEAVYRRFGVRSRPELLSKIR